MNTLAGARSPRARGFYEIGRTSPHRTALHADGDVLTYAALLAQVHRWSNLLTTTMALQRGDTIAMVLPNSAQFVTVQLAAEQTGLHLVPINWHLTVAEIAYLLADSGAQLVVTEEPLESVVAAAAENVGLTAGRVLVAGNASQGRPVASLLDAQPVTPPEQRSGGSMHFYSSGTSGRPKGIRRPLPDPHRDPGAIADVRSRQRSAQFGLDIDAGRVHLAVAPLYHPGPNLNALSALHLGQELILTRRFDPRLTLNLIDAHGVTSTFMVPVMFHRLLSLPEPERAEFGGSSLQVVMHAGAPCPAELKQAMIRWWGPVLTEYYGCTEFGMATLITAEEWLRKPGSVGRPAEGISLEVRDDQGHPLPPGHTGTVYVRGGYDFAYTGAAADGDAAGPAAADDPYRTAGDLGRLDEDGYLFIVDRRADLIISGGVNIYPAEVEAALATEPSVADVVVVGTPDEEWGQRVVAVVELHPGHEPGEPAVTRLTEHLASRLARFKSPRAYRFVDSVPRTSLGKVNRSQVLQALTRTTSEDDVPAPHGR
ncbi:AMP-binding protein [Micromonospora sp. B11E3]|uniref:AMP-binding protein n=1 Tax=Micromonospora sp. B11E3 TaxID=3153562 RepID=UPI00325CE62A